MTKFVSQSVHKKYVHENKRLRNDIKVLIDMDFTKIRERALICAKWHTIFEIEELEKEELVKNKKVNLKYKNEEL